jgi:hypothetical protein
MTDRNDDDPLNQVIGAFRGMAVPEAPEAPLLFTRPPSDRATGEPDGTSSSRKIWRILMHPTVRYGAAATILIVAFGWLAFGPSSSLAMADVIRAAESHKLVKYQFQLISAERPGMPRTETRGTVYVDLVKPRSRFEAAPEPADDGKSAQNVTVSDRERRVSMFQRNMSQKVTTKTGEVQTVVSSIESIMGQQVDQVGKFGQINSRIYSVDELILHDVPDHTLFLDALTALQTREGTTSAKAQLGGREVIVFSAKQGLGTTTVWVDPKTKLPVRIEQTFHDGGTGRETIRNVSSDFVWDPPAADVEALFRIPRVERPAADNGAAAGKSGAAASDPGAQPKK